MAEGALEWHPLVTINIMIMYRFRLLTHSENPFVVRVVIHQFIAIIKIMYKQLSQIESTLSQTSAV